MVFPHLGIGIEKRCRFRRNHCWHLGRTVFSWHSSAARSFWKANERVKDGEDQATRRRICSCYFCLMRPKAIISMAIIARLMRSFNLA